MYLFKSRHFLVIFLLGSALLSGCSSTPTYVPYNPTGPVAVSGGTPGFGGPQDVYHVVGPLEGLWRISKTYDVDIDTLMKVNGISDPSKIQKGQRLLIPNTMGPKPVITLFPTNRWTHIVIHHTATHEGDAFSIDEIHKKRGFWNGLGYHFIINNGTKGKTDGQIQAGPRWMKQQNGAHANAAGMNESGIGIALIGNFSQQRVTSTEIDSLVFLVRTLQDYYSIPSRNVIGHRDVPGKNTECPGNYFPWTEFKNRLN